MKGSSATRGEHHVRDIKWIKVKSMHDGFFTTRSRETRVVAFEKWSQFDCTTKLFNANSEELENDHIYLQPSVTSYTVTS